MKNKLFKPILLSLLALSLVGCDTNEHAMADKDSNENQIVEAKDEDMNTENKPAEDKIKDSKAENTEEDKKEDVEEDKEEDKEDIKKEEKNQAPSTKKDDKEKNLHKEDGKYVTTLVSKFKGEPSDYITSTAYAYKIEDDRFIVSGSFDYFKNPDDYENATAIKNETEQRFVITDKTEFEAVGGMAPAKKFSREDFLKYLEECKDSGLALIIFVENGVAKTVSISS
ncbi:hypothetical protein [uncultured Anaerococcus sp.]|uniref:hypothetical protein n=1 Tax=uncultured Anaerococcus sp. TaxID=293428 RepID=UPI00288AA841|nr:hypothetical protein [uncultured Anaerococcus sp.]